MYEPSEPQEQTLTTWKNPLDRDVRLDLYVGSHIVNRAQPSPFHRFTVPAGGTKAIPSEYDDAIAKLDESGRIVVSGKAPFMQRVGMQTEVHPSLAASIPAMSFATPPTGDDDKADAAAQRAAIARKSATPSK